MQFRASSRLPRVLGLRESYNSWKGLVSPARGAPFATRERRQQCPLGGGLDLATSTLTLLTRNLRETYALNPVQEPTFWVCPCLHFGWTVLRDISHGVS